MISHLLTFLIKIKWINYWDNKYRVWDWIWKEERSTEVNVGLIFINYKFSQIVEQDKLEVHRELCDKLCWTYWRTYWQGWAGQIYSCQLDYHYCEQATERTSWLSLINLSKIFPQLTIMNILLLIAMRVFSPASSMLIFEKLS